VSANFSNADGAFHGAAVDALLNKDTAAPAAPSASVASGTYTSAQNVELKAAEGTIRYTTDGSAPTASSTAYSKAITVSSTQTIKAVAVDAAGNLSSVASFDYTIAPPAAAPAPAPKPAPVALPKLKLDALTVSNRMSLRSARKRGIHAVIFAPEGAKVVKIRLLRNGHVITRIVRKVTGDGVMTVALPSTKKGRRALRRGTYKLQVTAGQSTTSYGVTSTRTIRVR
ncbi:MAG TPA: chitobiase/beta-hexosaminidase C-terminal domain-containing protein, partial [Solirubrobacteraceae bacterium]